MTAAAGTTPRDRALSAAKAVSAALVAGALAGLVIGGLGGRIAMLVLRLTSDPSLHGLETDDGFTIGIVSSATLFLVILTTVAGGVGGLAYGAVRSWLPERLRPWLFGSLTGVVGGALVIRPGGIDFTRLEPLGLAVVMFVALPAAYGVATSLLAERFLDKRSAFQSARSSIAGLAVLLPIVLFGAIGLLVVVLILGSVVIAGSGARLASFWSSAPVTWLGRAILAFVGVVGTVALAHDVAAVL